MDVYTPSLVPRHANRPNCWTRSRIGVACEEIGAMCLVKSAALAVYSIASVAAGPPTPDPPLSFLECDRRVGQNLDVGEPNHLRGSVVVGRGNHKEYLSHSD
jgi:hypothetical protein